APASTHLSTLSLHDALPIFCDDVNVLPSKSPTKYCVAEPVFGPPGFILTKSTHFLPSDVWNGNRSGHSQTPPCAPTPSPNSLKRDRKSTRLNSSHVKISYAV